MSQDNAIVSLKKNSPVLKEAFFSLIKLSTKLIDINWDKTILQTCLQATDSQDLNSSLRCDPPCDECLIGQCRTFERAKKRRMAQRQQEAIDLVYERMYKKFVKELFKIN